MTTTLRKRWTREQLLEVTGKTRQSAQKRWFKLAFGVDVPADAFGPIMTDGAYDALVRKGCGVLNQISDTPISRPKVNLRRPS